MAGRPWTAVPGALVVTVRLTPKGGRDSIDGIDELSDGSAVLKARVRAAPHEGAANDALIRLLAKAVGLAPRHVTLAGGATARIKRIRLEGDPAVLGAQLERLADNSR